MQLQVIAVKSKAILANSIFQSSSTDEESYGEKNVIICFQQLLSWIRLTWLAVRRQLALWCAPMNEHALRYLLSYTLDFYLLQLWKSVLWRLLSSWFYALFLETLIVCELNFKLRSAHAQIVSTLTRPSIMSLALITSSSLIHSMYIINK